LREYIEEIVFSSIGFPVIVYSYIKQSWYPILGLALFVIAYSLIKKVKTKPSHDEKDI